MKEEAALASAQTQLPDEQQLATAKDVIAGIIATWNEYLAHNPSEKKEWGRSFNWFPADAAAPTNTPEEQTTANIDIDRSLQSLVKLYTYGFVGDGLLKQEKRHRVRRRVATYLLEHCSSLPVLAQSGNQERLNNINFLLDIATDWADKKRDREHLPGARDELLKNAKGFLVDDIAHDALDRQKVAMLLRMTSKQLTEHGKEIIDMYALEYVKRGAYSRQCIDQFLENAFHNIDQITPAAIHFVHSVARHCSLNGESLIEAWKEGGPKYPLNEYRKKGNEILEMKNLYFAKNLAVLCDLQRENPEALQFLVRERGIMNLARYYRQTLRQQYDERNKAGKYYFLATARHDWNGAHSSPKDHQVFVDALRFEKKHDEIMLRMVEVTSLQDLGKKILRTHKTTAQQNSDGVILLAHSNNNLIHLSDKMDGQITAQSLKSSEKYHELVAHCFNTGAQLLLVACNAAKKRYFIFAGIAESLARSLRCQVQATAGQPGGLRRLQQRSDGKFDIHFHDADTQIFGKDAK